MKMPRTVAEREGPEQWPAHSSLQLLLAERGGTRRSRTNLKILEGNVFSVTPNDQKHSEFLKKGLEKPVWVLNQHCIWGHILARESWVLLEGQSTSVSLDTCHSYSWTTMKQLWTEFQ